MKSIAGMQQELQKAQLYFTQRACPKLLALMVSSSWLGRGTAILHCCGFSHLSSWVGQVQESCQQSRWKSCT